MYGMLAFFWTKVHLHFVWLTMALVWVAFFGLCGIMGQIFPNGSVEGVLATIAMFATAFYFCGVLVATVVSGVSTYSRVGATGKKVAHALGFMALGIFLWLVGPKLWAELNGLFLAEGLGGVLWLLMQTIGVLILVVVAAIAFIFVVVGLMWLIVTYICQPMAGWRFLQQIGTMLVAMKKRVCPLVEAPDSFLAEAKAAVEKEEADGDG